MKMTRSRVALLVVAAFLVAPMIFSASVTRQRSGSLTIVTLRGSNLRVYHSDSGDHAFAWRSEEDVWKVPEWHVTRRNPFLWHAFGWLQFYLELPFFLPHEEP